MSVSKVKLGDIAEIVSGATPKTGVKGYWNGEIAWATPKDLSSLQSKFISRTSSTITAEGHKSCSAKLLPANSVLLSSRAPIGHVAINTAPMATNQGFKSFIPKPQYLDSTYLYYWLKANNAHLQSLGRGATFKEISKAIVEKIEIPLPPLEQQKRIAAILDKADELRTNRRRAIQKVDDLLKSVFFELMARNEESLMKLKLNDISSNEKSSFVNGPFGSDLLTSELVPFGVPVVYIRDIRSGEYMRVSKSYVTPEKAVQLAACSVMPQDVLIAKVGDPPGTAAVYPDLEPNAVVTQDVVRIRPNLRAVTPDFLTAYLNSDLGRHKLKAITVEATRSRFSLRDFKAMEIEIPPLAEQAVYSRHAKTIVNQREMQRQQTQSLNALFLSLQTQAFSGGLASDALQELELAGVGTTQDGLF